MKGEISYRHPAVNIYAFCCKVGQYVGIDFLLEPVAIQGTAVLHIFFSFLFCFRRKAKEKSRNVEKVEQSVSIVYFCITLCHYLATFETIQWKQRGRWIELLQKRYDKLDDDDILLFVCVLFSFVFSCWVSRTGKVSDGLRPSVWGSYFSRGYVWPFSA